MKFTVKQNVKYDGQDFSGLTGTVDYISNGYYMVSFDEESINKLPEKYKKWCVGENLKINEMIFKEKDLLIAQ